MAQIHPSQIRGLILDMDGVLWRGPQPIGDLADVFDQIDRLGWRAVLATNNGTRSAEEVLRRLSSYGVGQIEPWQIVNSSQAVAYYLKTQYPGGGPVYVVGETAVVEAVLEQGFTLAETEAVAVVASMDRGLTYEKLAKATLLVRSGVPLVATNPDRTFPTPEGEVPGAGAIVAALEAATGVSAVVVGKPSPHMYRVALKRLGTEPGETLVVGDRLETDIVGAQALGCPSALLLSGVTTRGEVDRWSPPPDWIAADLTSFLAAMRIAVEG